MLGPVDVAPGVAWVAARTPTLPPATHTNSYALGTGEVLLVEPATPIRAEQDAWLAWARGLASAGARLVALFVTHHHADHVGGAERFARELGLPLWAHAATAERLPHLTFARRLDEGDAIALDGPTPQRWRCLHTPGHAPGHLCLYAPELGLAVVGDMVASEGTILIEPAEGDMARYLDELRRLAELELRMALPAHGAPVAAEHQREGSPASSPRELFRHYVRHRLLREHKIEAALAALTAGARPAPDDRGAGGASLDELVARAYDDTPRAAWPYARLSLEAHLVKLEREGRAARRGAGWAVGSSA
ncbi:MAG: MBL fold metallo-hydrolase [Myxococcales bacterium]|nr:MBL fold metallo-hydrolase [Myxococcales bacterium]